MAQTGGYREELEKELHDVDQSSHASRLITQEIERLDKGEDEKKERPVPWLEIHTERQQKLSVKIRVPIKEHPRWNFVGKLLGPKGQTLKDLQQQTGCKMAIMGKGSIRDKDKEEEFRREGGKYAHLNEDLHVLVDCFTEPIDGYHRMAAAFVELRKFLIPEMSEDMYGGGDMGMGEMGMNGSGAPRGRGSFRGGPPERGARGGGMRGRGAPMGGGRGAPTGRGAPRGSMRGAPAARGAAPARGGARPAPAPAASYEGYGAQGYGSEQYAAQDYGSYDDGYSAQGGDASYYDYGASQTAAGGYDSYSGAGAYDYGDGYSNKAAAPSSRGSARGARPSPYSRPSGGGY